ncbi:hypothetical protein CBS101457_004239 [Exobasidium rhododendri]|nr:hypothetical protein CBS101457_004239 [Exobasidium rhododendri]
MSDDRNTSQESISTVSEQVTPVTSRLRVSLKQNRGLDPYTAALSGDHEVAAHHVLTLMSRATRFGTSTINLGSAGLSGEQVEVPSSKLPIDDIADNDNTVDVADTASMISNHLPSWIQNLALPDVRSQSIMPLLSFQNPWESFKAAGIFEAWHGGLQWGLPEGYVEGGEHHSAYKSLGSHNDQNEAIRDVAVVKPEWDIYSDDDIRDNVRVTWLGHASILIQLPNKINILFDPIFVDRASPSQNAGPIRFTKPPCQISDLPKIDIVCISHNHYDHLSWECMRKLREREKDRGGIKVFCPLGNIAFFAEAKFDRDSVVEMDWWDEAEVLGEDIKAGQIKIMCTPAQHGSGRGGGDQCKSLWSSWLVQYKEDDNSVKSFRTFFAGDTGLRSHNTSRPHRHEFVTCPIFREISLKYGVPHLLLLPISVGSSLSYFRSWDPFPRRFSPFPAIQTSMTSAIHMDSEDAAHCHRIMTLVDDEVREEQDKEAVKRARKDIETRGVTSLAIHYATFVRNEQQTRADVRDLKKACEENGINFIRTEKGGYDLEGGKENGRFLVTDQGETVLVPLQ